MDYDLIKYDVAETHLIFMEKKYMNQFCLDKTSPEEAATFKRKRLDVKKIRTSVESKRKELKSDALAWGKAVDKEARKLRGRLEPIEQHLAEQEGKHLEYVAKIEEEARQVRLKVIRDRVDSLLAFGCVMSHADVASLSDEAFQDLMIEAESAHVKKLEKEAQEKADRQAEADRLEIERKRLAEERQKMEEERAIVQAKIDAIEAREAADREVVMVSLRRFSAAALAACQVKEVDHAHVHAVDTPDGNAAIREIKRMSDATSLHGYFSALLDIEVPALNTNKGTELLKEFYLDLTQMTREVLQEME